MGALLLYFVGGSIVAVPFLAYQLLRTRRELNELRAELRRRGLIAPAPEGPRVGVGTEGHARLAGGAASALADVTRQLPASPGHSDAPTLPVRDATNPGAPRD